MARAKKYFIYYAEQEAAAEKRTDEDAEVGKWKHNNVKRCLFIKMDVCLQFVACSIIYLIVAKSVLLLYQLFKCYVIGHKGSMLTEIQQMLYNNNKQQTKNVFGIENLFTISPYIQLKADIPVLPNLRFCCSLCLYIPFILHS